MRQRNKQTNRKTNQIKSGTEEKKLKQNHTQCESERKKARVIMHRHGCWLFSVLNSFHLFRMSQLPPLPYMCRRSYVITREKRSLLLSKCVHALHMFCRLFNGPVVTVIVLCVFFVCACVCVSWSRNPRTIHTKLRLDGIQRLERFVEKFAMLA